MPRAHKIQRRLMPPEYQAPEVLNQAAPVQNTWYTIGAVMLNARVYDVLVGVEDTNETLEVQITNDGQVIVPVARPCNHSVSYSAYPSPDAINRVDRADLQASSQTLMHTHRAFVWEGRSIEVEVRKITAAGVGNLVGIVTWGHYNPVDV